MMQSSLPAMQARCACPCQRQQSHAHAASVPGRQPLWQRGRGQHSAWHGSADSRRHQSGQALAKRSTTAQPCAATGLAACTSLLLPAPLLPPAPAPPAQAAAPSASLWLHAAASDLGDAALLLAATMVYSPVSPALAAGDSVAYDNSTGSEGLRTAFGVGYVLLVGFFAVRLLTKRARRAKTERLAGKKEDGAAQQDASVPVPQLSGVEEGSTTAWGALYGAAQAAFLFTVLWTLTTNLSGYFDAKPLPANYTARNITTAVKTAVEGLAYLLTFIFGANSLGLAALAVQLAFFPDAAVGPAAMPKADRNAPPKIKLTDNIYDIRRAFEEVQREASKSSGGGAEKE